VALAYLRAHAAALGLTAADLNNPVLARQHTDPKTEQTHIDLQQRINGLAVFNTDLAIRLTNENEVIDATSDFVRGASTPTNHAALSARQALVRAAAGLGLSLHATPTVKRVIPSSHLTMLSAPSLSKSLISAKLGYVTTGPALRLAWELLIRTRDGRHAYQIFVDAATGKSLGGFDWANHLSAARKDGDGLPILGSAASAASLQSHDGATMTVTLPPDGWEGQTLAGTVKIPAASASDLVVNLSSSDPTTVTTPASVTIPAGQVSIPFSVSLIDDGMAAGSRIASINATATSGSGSTSIIVHDAAVDHLAFDPISTPKIAGHFGVTVRAFNIANEIIATYGGAATLSASAKAQYCPSLRRLLPFRRASGAVK
jgi:hypothetical protein